MKKHSKLLFLLSIIFLLSSCSTVPVTNRKQLRLLPRDIMLSMSLSNYEMFLKENPALPSGDSRVNQVRNVGNKISGAVESFLREKGQASNINDYSWEFNVVSSEEINAWCMPGGKIVFYTGILPLTKNDAGIATVMGHEVAHAVARHGNERMTQQLAIMLGAVSLDYALKEKPEQTRQIFLMAYGAGSTLGSLAYSRLHEYEADKLGMIFMAKAGYDPSEAIRFWERMSAQGGAKPPELLSTHPSDEKRVQALKDFLPEAMKYYRKK